MTKITLYLLLVIPMSIIVNHIVWLSLNTKWYNPLFRTWVLNYIPCAFSILQGSNDHFLFRYSSLYFHWFFVPNLCCCSFLNCYLFILLGRGCLRDWLKVLNFRGRIKFWKLNFCIQFLLIVFEFFYKIILVYDKFLNQCFLV